MKYGKLFYDSEIDRVNVRWEDGSYGDGFHCGEVLEINIPITGEWAWHRIEYNHSKETWYFCGLSKDGIPFDTEIRA